MYSGVTSDNLPFWCWTSFETIYTFEKEIYLLRILPNTNTYYEYLLEILQNEKNWIFTWTCLWILTDHYEYILPNTNTYYEYLLEFYKTNRIEFHSNFEKKTLLFTLEYCTHHWQRRVKHEYLFSLQNDRTYSFYV